MLGFETRMTSDDSFYSLDPAFTDPARLKRERDKARELKKTQWWLTLVNRGICHYCDKKFKKTALTLDHVVPLARGGTSTRGNMVPACRACNREKKLDTPVDEILRRSARANESRDSDDDSGGDTE